MSGFFVIACRGAKAIETLVDSTEAAYSKNL